MRERMYSILRESGFDGGSIVFHPWRVRAWARAAYHESGYDGGVWDWLRDEGLLAPALGAIKFAPHYHVLGWGRLTVSDDFHRDSGGWIYKRPSDSLDPDSLGSVAAYLMTHRGVLVGGGGRIQMISQVGCVGARSLKKEETFIMDGAKCDVCDEPVYVVDGWVEGEGPDGPGGKTVPEVERIGIDGVPVGLTITTHPYARWQRVCVYHIRGMPGCLAIFGGRSDDD